MSVHDLNQQWNRLFDEMSTLSVAGKAATKQAGTDEVGNTTTHPVGQVDPQHKDISHGQKWKSDDAALEETIPGPTVTKAKKDSDRQVQFNIGNRQTGPGEDPKVEDKAKAYAQDPGTQHPAHVGQDKYAAHLQHFRTIGTQAVKLADDINARLAVQHPIVQPPVQQAPAAPVKEAAAAGVAAADEAAAEQARIKQAAEDFRQQFAVQVVAPLIKQAEDAATALVHEYAEFVKAAEGMPPQMGGTGMPPAEVEGSEVPPEVAGGAGGEGGEGGDFETHLLAVANELGISPAELLMMLQEMMGAGGGEGGGPPPPEMAAKAAAFAAWPEDARENLIGITELVKQGVATWREGKMKFRAPKTAEEVKIRGEMGQWLQDLVAGRRR